MPSYTKEEIDYIKRNYAKRGPLEIAHRLGALGYPQRSRKAITLKGRQFGLKYEGPKKGLFKKGQSPANKGKKMPAHVYEKAKATMFKKGQKPHNTVEVGTVVTRKNFDYQFKKVDEDQWELLHRSIWEKANGPIPEGCLIVFIDGNSLNCSLDNLECITREEHAIRNRFSDLMKWPLGRKIVDAYVGLSKFKKEVKQYVNE